MQRRRRSACSAGSNVQLRAWISSLRKIQNLAKPDLVIGGTTQVVGHNLNEKFGLQTHEGISHVWSYKLDIAFTVPREE